MKTRKTRIVLSKLLYLLPKAKSWSIINAVQPHRHAFAVSTGIHRRRQTLRLCVSRQHNRNCSFFKLLFYRLKSSNKHLIREIKMFCSLFVHVYVSHKTTEDLSRFNYVL